jgi:acetylornithine deacetylase/succinyl-diaminopimelate desuccinylase-like protein
VKILLKIMVLAAVLAVTAPFVAAPRATEPDWQKAEAELLEILTELIALNTTSPPGNEILVCRALQARLEREGIACEIVEPEPGRGSLIARLEGTGEKRPLLLLGHTDVVGVQEENWESDPWVLTERDGYYYGRGVIDDKGMVSAEALTLLLLKRSGVELDRDVIFLAEADEEAGGKFGVDWLIKNRPEIIDAEYALNEGGRIVTRDGSVAWIGLQNAEKRTVSLRLIARGTSGHASVPRPDNPVARLAGAIDRLAQHPFPVELTPETEIFFPAVARWQSPEMANAMRELGDPAKREGAAEVIGQDLMFGAMLRNTISPTILDAGFRSNVIPASAEGVINVRLLPGKNLDAVIEHLHTVIDDESIEIQFIYEPDPVEAPRSPFDGPIVDAVKQVVAELLPDASVVPFQSNGATDSATLRRAGIDSYGLLIFPLTREDEARFHADNERMPVSSLGLGLRLLYEVTKRAAQ